MPAQFYETKELLNIAFRKKNGYKSWTSAKSMFDSDGDYIGEIVYFDD